MPDPSVDLPLLQRWYNHYRPDAVLAFSPSVGAQLTQLGLSIPDDVAYADLMLEADDLRCAGVRQNSERVGEIATEMVVGLMQQNICGIPDVPTATLVEGTWVGGASLPIRRLPPAPASRDSLVDSDCVLSRSA
jgi:LacI family transcriptional regulator